MDTEEFKFSPEAAKNTEKPMTDEERSTREKREKELLMPENKTFNENNNTLLLHIGKDAVDLSRIQEMADKNGLDQKEEFHITVLGFKHGNEIKKVLKALPEAERQNKLSQIKSLVDSADLRFAPEPQTYHISKEYVIPDPNNKGANLRDQRESYIQMMYLPGMKTFFDQLNTLLGTNFEAPPAHTTLYTGGDNKETSKAGIGIHSQDELEKLHPTLI